MLTKQLSFAAVLLVSSTAMANGELVDICHHGAGDDGTIIIAVAPEAVDYHLSQHGDAVAGDYWSDSDGDGFGDRYGSYTMCPGGSQVDNVDDCDDSDPNTYPGAEEVCGDGRDNDCDGDVDEECGCPCFTYEDIDVAYATFQSERGDYDYSFPYCERYTGIGQTLRNIANLYFTMRNDDGTHFVNDYLQFYSEGSEATGGNDYCYYRDTHAEIDRSTGERVYVDYAYERILITPEERYECQATIEDWVSDNGLYCRTSL